MGIPLRIESPEGARLPGAMWRYPPGDEHGRECWWIILPNWHAGEVPGVSEVSWRTTDEASSPPHGMWDVTGTPPLITVSPSVDVERRIMRDGQPARDGSYWHGWIRNGEITDA